MSMMAASLASGSSGNSYYLQSEEGAVLVDAGLSGKRLLENLRAAGGDPGLVRGIIVTHDHRDHAAGAGALCRRHGWKLWLSGGTREAAAGLLGKVEAETVRPGSGLKAAGFSFEFIPTPHDGREPFALTAESGGRRCGVLTDLGHVFPGLAGVLDSLDFAFLESNYDPGLLAENPDYPPALKARIRGPRGHLANAEAAELARTLPGDRLRRVVLSHLSEANNRPEAASRSFAAAAAERGLRVEVAPRHRPTPLSRVGGEG